MTRSPASPLIVGLVVSLVTIGGMGWYTVREVRTLRDEQTAISERNRRDSLQLIRIQSNLGTVATALRDMADRVKPYPVIYWRQTFDRLRTDLDEAIALENTFCTGRAARGSAAAAARIGRPPLELARRGVAQAARGDEDGALARVRTSVGAQHQELVGLVSQFLVLNNRVQEEASQRNREVYERVVREIVVLVAALLVLVALIGAYTIWANRQAFQEVETAVGSIADALVAHVANPGRLAAILFAQAARRRRPGVHGHRHTAGPHQAQVARRLVAPWATWKRSWISRSRRWSGSGCSLVCCTRRCSTTSPREGRRMVHEAVRPSARHRDISKSPAQSGSSRPNPTSTSIGSCRRR